jgi:hypothetical protein
MKVACKTPGKEGVALVLVQESVVKVHLKIFHGVGDVQEAMMGMLDHCLAILHERDKMACFLNGKKTLEAHKATDFLRDFTDFYDNWGKWDQPIKSFLDTIPVNKSHSFAGSFYLCSKWDPCTLFEKTLLKMVSQKKHKGTTVIKLKPCQHLDTSRDIFFSTFPSALHWASEISSGGP